METFDLTFPVLTCCHHAFRSLVICLKKKLNVTSPQKQLTDVSLIVKDSDTKSENLSLLIRLSVSDG